MCLKHFYFLWFILFPLYNFISYFMNEVKVGFLFFILLNSCNLDNFCLKQVFAGLYTSVLKTLALSEATVESHMGA